MRNQHHLDPPVEVEPRPFTDVEPILSPPEDTCDPDAEHIQWLLDRSLLRLSESRQPQICRPWSPLGTLLCAHPPSRGCSLSSVWLTTYPPSMITGENETVLTAMSSSKFWHALNSLGIGCPDDYLVSITCNEYSNNEPVPVSCLLPLV